jgi:divalent metal cation (Fe/Co/Zn/Cd) transporter
MPLLGRAKQRIGSRIGSSATASEGKQNLLCAYLAGALLVGLLGNALFGAWWLDPAVALFIAYVATAKAGRPGGATPAAHTERWRAARERSVFRAA